MADGSIALIPILYKKRQTGDGYAPKTQPRAERIRMSDEYCKEGRTILDEEGTILYEDRTHNIIGREYPPREEAPLKPRESQQEEHRPHIVPPVQVKFEQD